ncbi:glutathione S-transferase kappa 1 [Lojkania enalia]|uniref:Glutathione S-transferase kappa n=1 Tax=Lojkania enalia TaxID=147567 RepID=A0A9P4TS16_9PLEO|nr:glutathione S-transferase kappa 1 [Didymosphaeria enalia]
MSGKITCYLDVVSPYSYFALLHLERHREALKSHNVEIDIVPVFLGGIMGASGNKPPWMLPAKAKYSTFDSSRAKKYFGVHNFKTPSFFPILSLLPQRALIFIKAQHPQFFIPTFLDFYKEMWENGIDLSKSELLTNVLSKSFTEPQIREIFEKASSPDWKKKLNDNTDEALSHGAFGCPWFWVKNAVGDEEPFFGSDRFHNIWEYLGLPWKDVELLPKERSKI